MGEAQEWPLDDVEDAILMRHFVETIAPWVIRTFDKPPYTDML